MQPLELQLRERRNGLAAEGLLLGLWVGDILVSTEYWLLRGAALGLRALRSLFMRPVRLTFAVGTVAAGALALGSRSQAASERVVYARLDETSIVNAASRYRMHTGRWPARLEILVPNYLKDLRSDPWGHNYSVYRGDGGFAVVSAGPDGDNGTNDDVVQIQSNQSLSCPSGCLTGRASTGRPDDSVWMAVALGCPHWAVIPGVGARLTRLGPGVLAAAGLQPNDLVVKMNGISLASLQGSIEAYRTLRDADPLNLEILRDEKPIQMVIGRDFIESQLQGE